MPGKRYTEKEKQEMLKIIRRVYEEKGSIRKAGQAAGVSSTTARNWLKEDGVKLQDPRSRNEIEYDPEDLRKLADKGLTEKEIGVKMHASKATVRMWLKENGIKINLEARKARRQEEKKKSQPSEDTQQKKKCKTCRYRSGNPNYGCNYVMIKKHRRGCQVIGCERYEKGNRIRLREESIGA